MKLLLQRIRMKWSKGVFINKHPIICYRMSKTGEILPDHESIRGPRSKHSSSLWNGRAFLDQYFLPRNYESSVPQSYIEFTKWHFISSVASSTSVVLSTQSLLFAVGLGAGSIPAAAALNWILKDGLGQLGGILYASVINNRFDADPKKWRFIAAIALDVSTFVELCTPIFPSQFLLLASFANIGKNVSWLSASSTRAAIHQSFAMNENLGDITGKAGSQSIAASIIGTAFGILLSTTIGSSTSDVMAMFVALSSMHLGCLTIALKNASLPTLNSQRLDILLSHFVDRGGIIPSIEWVGRQEKLFSHRRGVVRTDLGLDLAIPTVRDLEQIRGILHSEKYLLTVIRHPSQFTVFLKFERAATAEDIIRGHLHAKLLERVYSEHDDIVEMLSRSYSEMKGDRSTIYTATRLLDQLHASSWHATQIFEDQPRYRILVDRAVAGDERGHGN